MSTYKPFAVLLGDEVFTGEKPCLSELIDQFEAHGGGGVIAVRPVPWDQVSRYGVVEPQHVGIGLHRIRSMVEKPGGPASAPSNLAVVGRYIIAPEIFPILDATRPGRGGEIQLTDALNQLAQSGALYACETRARRFDVGNKLGYIQAMLEFALERPDLGPELLAYLQDLTESRPARRAAVSGDDQTEQRRGGLRFSP